MSVSSHQTKQPTAQSSETEESKSALVSFGRLRAKRSLLNPTLDPTSKQRQADIALDLIADAAAALSAMLVRCEDLQNSIDAAESRSFSDLQRTHEEYYKWQQTSDNLKLQVQQLESEIQGCQRRVAEAEKEIASINAVIETSQRSAAESNCLSSLFRDEIITSFGAGSATHQVLESMRINAHGAD